MRPAQLSAQEILSVIRRRKKMLILPFALVAGLCIIGAFVLPKKYESSATIMVQQDQVLNPLMNFTMAVATASEDRLRTFNEIVYSKSTLQLIVDSLRLAPGTMTENEHEELLRRIRKDLSTDRPGPATFKISYLDSDPRRAKRAVELATNYYIKTVLQVENQRNELAVEFYERKLEELRQKFESTQTELVTMLRNRISDSPTEERTISSRIDDADKQIGTLNDNIQSYQRAYTSLTTAPDQMGTDQGKQTLFDLQRKDLPFVGDLRPLVDKYDELTRRYTYNYPEVEKIQKQILDLLTIMKTTVEKEVLKQRKELWDLEARRADLIEALKRTTVSQQVDKEKQSNYEVFRGLYDDMKIKLEQARTTRDLGRKGGEQFIIIDPAVVASDPAKPNRLLIILGGLVLGLFLGMLTVVTTEILDTRIRDARDVAVYRKRIIAYIPEGKGV